MAAVDGIEIFGTRPIQEFSVRHNRGVVSRYHIDVVAAQNVNVCRHMQQVTGIRHKGTQTVAMTQRALRVRRHFHKMGIHVQQTGVIPCPVECVEGVFQNTDRLESIGAVGRLPCRKIPQLPWRAVHDRFGKQTADIEIIAMVLIDLSHGIGVGVVPRPEIVDCSGLRIALSQGFNQRGFRRICFDGKIRGLFNRF